LVFLYYLFIIVTVSNEDKLIKNYRHELVPDHHNFGSDRYGLKVLLPVDISPAFPYLNAVLSDTIYDHENGILIGFNGKKRYAFRPHEIQLGMVPDPTNVEGIIKEVVDLVNRTWDERETIIPSLKERALPPAFELYRVLPRTNCGECGYPTCLAFAADLRSGKVGLEKCVKLLEPEHADAREKISSMLSSR
jgi:ArsR family metal-binding transcriptional regulator